jgi:hypothetical protein
MTEILRFRFFSFLLALSAVVLFSSCDREDNDLTCEEKYFTTMKTSSSEYHATYDASGKIVNIYTLDGSVKSIQFRFVYNQEGKLVEGHESTDIYFEYDDQGRVRKFAEYEQETEKLMDSVIFLYDRSNRLRRKDLYAIGYPHAEGLVLNTYSEYDYDGASSVVEWQYEIDGENFPEMRHRATITYTYDNYHAVYPEAVLPFFYYKTSNPRHDGNIVMRQLMDEVLSINAVEDYSYEYNAYGYPVKRIFNGAVLNTYTYSCEASVD